MAGLRVLHVSPYYEHAWAYGGVPRVVAAATRALYARGHAVTVCTTDAVSRTTRLGVRQSSPTAMPNGAPSVRVFRNLSNRAAYDWQLFVPRGLASYLRRHARDFDVAHLHACHNLLTAIAARACRKAGVPYILSPHGTAPRIERRRTAKWLFDVTAGRRVLRDAARIVAVSSAERAQLLHLGISSDRVRVVPNPIDLDEFTPPVSRGAFRRTRGLEDEPIVMFLGKLTPRKRLDVLARAFAMLTGRRARLVIAGNDMGSGEPLHRLIEQLGLSSRVMFTGLLEGRSRLEALADADVVAYPSMDEVFGLVPLEALLTGTPVVVANDSGCGETVERMGGGLTVPPGNEEALAQALDTILSTTNHWRDEAQAAARRVRAFCEPAAVAAELEAAYLEVITR